VAAAFSYTRKQSTIKNDARSDKKTVLTAVVTHVGEFMNVSPAAQDKTIFRIQVLEHFFSFFEHFLQVISSRQVNLDAFMLNPKQARTDDKGRCEY